MHRFLRIVAAFLLAGGAGAILAQSGPLDPAFKNIPFDTWVDQGDQAHIRWTARVLPVELSNHQRLQAKIDIQVDGNELARRRGKGFFVVLAQFTDKENRVYQTHEAIDLQLVKDDIGKSNVSYIPSAFVIPGDYRISLVVLATATKEHSAMQLQLHVNPLKNDPLAGSWRDLPPVEMLQASQSPDDLFLPNITGRLNLPLETRRPVRVDIIVNASPVSAGEPSRTEQIGNRSLTSLIPALKVLSEANVRNGTLNVVLLDLTTQHVIFQQDALHELDWPKLGPALKESGPNKIDIHALENRRQNAQFFVSQVSRRIESGAPKAKSDSKNEPWPVLIVLSGPMAFASGEDLHPIELAGKPDAEVFYFRYHSLPERQPINPFEQEQRRMRRSPMSQPGRGPTTEPVDSLEHTLKPLQPHLYDVYTPAEFRKALANMFEELSKL
ncbi:MAG TPA: hypothetical protein VNX70_07930 [Bryobacteraceae bacterium]|nr:hypothetical protein [Bryobacteraceae bacterium]